MKIKAYTLLEVTIAMLLSAICITICYTVYGIVTSYYITFHEKNEVADGIMSLKYSLAHDFSKGKYVFKSDSGLTVQVDTTKIFYSFSNQQVLRKMNELHTDTFKVQAGLLLTYFENVEVNSADTIDQINFSVLLKGTIIPIQVNKYYSATDLFK